MEDEGRPANARAKRTVLHVYRFAVDAVVIGLVSLMVLVLLYAFVDVLASAYHLVPYIARAELGDAEFRVLIQNVLDVFIVIELFSVFTEYVRTEHVRISNLLDVAIVFVLRELLVKLYANKFAVEDLIGLCIIALMLVIGRSIAHRFPAPRR